MILYWCPWVIQSLSFIEFPEITRLSSTLAKQVSNEITDLTQAYHKCPATRLYAKNIFELKSPVEFEIIRDGNGGFYTNHGDQTFWNDFVQIRNENLISFNVYYMFIPDFDVEIEVSSAHFADNDFTKKTMIVPGRFNAYKWIRPIQCSFVLKEGTESIKINRGDTLMYLRVCTDSSIKTKKFFANPFLGHVVDMNLGIKHRLTKNITPLAHWYEMYENSKIRKKIMKEITSNLLED